MDIPVPDLRTLLLGLVLGAALVGLFVVISSAQSLRTGFYGLPPNATWYDGPHGTGAVAPASSAH